MTLDHDTVLAAKSVGDAAASTITIAGIITVMPHITIVLALVWWANETLSPGLP